MPLRRNNTIHGSNQKKNGGCFKCVTNVPVFSPDELEIGDHVVFKGCLYDHHGIITGKKDGCVFEVTEATNTSSKAMAAIAASTMFGGKAKIKRSWKIINFNRKNVGVVVYRIRFLKNETASLAIRIHKIYTENPAAYKYHLITNNCEHFAAFCVTGEMFSLQVANFVSNVSHLFTRSDLESELKRKCMKYMICIPCFQPVEIKSKHDIKKGDIIVHLEHGLWHYRVVLKTEQTTSTSDSVTCLVAHNTSCAQGARGMINTDNISIRPNRSIYKLDFASSGFEVCRPDDVVKRAHQFIGEKMLEYFINECSNFPIWCKLNF